MNVVNLYKCMGDELRLRILNLLREGPLCVCHLCEVLDCDQIKMSKQLRYMKELGILSSERQAQWIIYQLAEPDLPLLRLNLDCLLDCAKGQLALKKDLAKRQKVIAKLQTTPAKYAEAVLEKCC